MESHLSSTMDLDTQPETTIDTTPVTENAATSTTTTKDPLDNALADQQTHDYDSSDLELSSSDENDIDSSDEEQNLSGGDDDDDDDDNGGKPTAPRSTNEVTDIAVDTPVVKEITADMKVEPIGHIVSVLGTTVLVQQSTITGSPTVLDMGSLLVFNQDRKVLGEVFETLGPVESPYYSVRFNSVDDMDLERIVKGASIGYVPGYERTQLVQVEQLKLIKGTDASNQYDEEVGADELEFSDDEKEMEYRRKTKKKGKKGQAKQQQQQQQQQIQKRPLEDASVPDGRRRQIHSYADIMTTTSSSSINQQEPFSLRPQHPDYMTALLDSYMGNQQPPANVKASQVQQPIAQRHITKQPSQQPTTQQQPQQPLATQPQQQPQQSQPLATQPQQQSQQSQPLATQPQQQSQQSQPEIPPPQQQSTWGSTFQSIRALFARGPPPS